MKMLWKKIYMPKPDWIINQIKLKVWYRYQLELPEELKPGNICEAENMLIRRSPSMKLWQIEQK